MKDTAGKAVASVTNGHLQHRLPQWMASQQRGFVTGRDTVSSIVHLDAAARAATIEHYTRRPRPDDVDMNEVTHDDERLRAPSGRAHADAAQARHDPTPVAKYAHATNDAIDDIDDGSTARRPAPADRRRTGTPLDVRGDTASAPDACPGAPTHVAQRRSALYLSLRPALEAL